MTLNKLLSTIGILLILWAILSGINLHYSFSEAGSVFKSGYTFKVGTAIAGIILLFLGRRLGRS
jgi:hypothetical protein